MALRWEQVLAWRVERQHLARRAAASAALQVVSDIGGLHAQLMSSAVASLDVRVSGASVPDLLASGELVKTWAQRGTLHLHRPDDLALYVGAFATMKPRHHAASWQKHFGLSQAEADTLFDAVAQVLRAAPEPLTRDELEAAVLEHTGSARLAEKVRDGFGAYLKLVAMRGELIYGPDRGRNVTFTAPRGLSVPDPDEAAREVTRRYLRAYGPAPREQYARWFGCQPPHAGRLIKALGDEVVELDGFGWALAEDLESLEAAQPQRTVNLLPAFDQYVVGAPRGEPGVLGPAYAERVYRPQGWISPVLLVDGVIRGTWEVADDKPIVHPFEPLEPWVRERL
jgi:hypothetical protein